MATNTQTMQARTFRSRSNPATYVYNKSTIKAKNKDNERRGTNTNIWLHVLAQKLNYIWRRERLSDPLSMSFLQRDTKELQ